MGGLHLSYSGHSAMGDKNVLMDDVRFSAYVKPSEAVCSYTERINIRANPEL